MKTKFKIALAAMTPLLLFMLTWLPPMGSWYPGTG